MAIRLPTHKIRLFLLVLLPLARSSHGKLTEAELIELVTRSGLLTESEKSSVKSRTDSRFANQVHNEVSHRSSRGNMIRHRLIEWCQDSASFSITHRGRDFISRAAANVPDLTGTELEKCESWLRTNL